MKRALFVLALAACTSVAFSQVVINAGTSTFGWTSNANLTGAGVHTGTGGGTSAVYTVNGSPNQAFQNWWWYRVNGVNVREFALSTQSAAPVVSGNNMILQYREAEGFTSRLEYTILNQTNGAARVTGTNFVKNEGNTNLSLDFFNYIDYDLNGTTADNASLVAPNPAIRIRVVDTTSPWNLEYRAMDGIAYQVGAFANIRTLLTDVDADNLNNTGLPFGPADFSGAVQWRFNLGPGQMIALQTSYDLNPVPEPATMVGLALGVGALIRRRRK